MGVRKKGQSGSSSPNKPLGGKPQGQNKGNGNKPAPTKNNSLPNSNASLSKHAQEQQDKQATAASAAVAMVPVDVDHLTPAEVKGYAGTKKAKTLPLTNPSKKRLAREGAPSSNGTGRPQIYIHGEHAEHMLAAVKDGHVEHWPKPDHVHDDVTTFWRKYLFSMDHKIIGLQFLFMSLAFMIVAGGLALLFRWQLGFPNKPMPGSFMFSENYFNAGIMSSQGYNQFFTMHASLMIFFVIIPMMVGAFGNFLVPIQIGARDMAFPFLNGLSFWVTLLSGIIMAGGFLFETGAAAAGWTSYPPISLTGGPGQACWLISIFLLGFGSIMGAINYITTILNMRAPGMTLFRMPLTVWSIFITSLLILFSTPVLGSAGLLQLSDLLIGTSFFIPKNLSEVTVPGLAARTGGGEPLMFQHLFWFYSHPAVYIMILPAMGIVSEVLSTFARKPIFGYKFMVWAIAGIAGLGYIVWGHHMFVSGMNPLLGTTFMLSTMLIAVPSGIKVFNWLGTLWGGDIRLTSPMLFAMGFVSMFTIGGLSGIFMASTPVDLQIHDTYFIVGHIHYVLFGGSMFGIMAGIYFWFPKFFGRKMNETLGKIHFWLTFVGFNCTFFPMHILGTGAMMRRIPDPSFYEYLRPLQPMNTFISVSAFALGAGMLVFAYNFLGSLYARRTPATLVQNVVAICGRAVSALSIAFLVSLALDIWLKKPGAETMAAEASGVFFWLNHSASSAILVAVAVGLFVGLYVARDLTHKVMSVAIVAVAALPFGKIFDVLANWSFYHGDRFVNGEPMPDATGLFPWIYTGLGLMATVGFVVGFGYWALAEDTTLAQEAGDNPWEATTLEWDGTSPPFYANFRELPTVYHGPHEYNVPGLKRDWLPQSLSYKQALAQERGN